VIDHARVVQLADASRIELAPEEVPRLTSQLGDILEQMSVLLALDAESGAQCEDPTERDNATDVQQLRADEAGPDTLHGTPGRFAPDLYDGFFTVPRIQ
jgi:aspartyl/glutamyl-tRNA(Asn/Gln) amidotransferase C subunit